LRRKLELDWVFGCQVPTMGDVAQFSVAITTEPSKPNLNF
jgi:hypothetical protein